MATIISCGLLLLIVIQSANREDALPLSTTDATLLAQLPPVPPPETLPSIDPSVADRATFRLDKHRETEEEDVESVELCRKEHARIVRELVSDSASIQNHRLAAQAQLRAIVTTLKDGHRPVKERKVAFARSVLAFFPFPEGQQEAAEDAKTRFLDSLNTQPTDDGDKPDVAEVLDWLRIQACLRRVDTAENGRKSLSRAYALGQVDLELMTEKKQRSILAKADLVLSLLDGLAPGEQGAEAVAAKEALRAWLHIRHCEQAVDCASLVWERSLARVSPRYVEEQARAQLCEYVAQWLSARLVLGDTVKTDEAISDRLLSPLQNAFFNKASECWGGMSLESEERQCLKALRDVLVHILSATAAGRSPSDESVCEFARVLVEIPPLDDRDPVLRDAKTALLSCLAAAQSGRQGNRLSPFDQHLQWLRAETLLHRWVVAGCAWNGVRDAHILGIETLDLLPHAHDQLVEAKRCFVESALDGLALARKEGEARAAIERIRGITRLQCCQEAYERSLETWYTTHELWEEGRASLREEAIARERVHHSEALRQAALASVVGDMPAAGLRMWTLQDGRSTTAAMVEAEPQGQPIGPGTSLTFQNIDGRVLRVPLERLIDQDQQFCIRRDALVRRRTTLDLRMFEAEESQPDEPAIVEPSPPNASTHRPSGISSTGRTVSSDSPDWSPVKTTLKIVLDAVSTDKRVPREAEIAFLRSVIAIAPLETAEEPDLEKREVLLLEATQERNDSPLAQQEVHRWQETEAQLNRVLAAHQESNQTVLAWQFGMLSAQEMLGANERLLTARMDFAQAALAAMSDARQDRTAVRARAILLRWLEVGMMEMARERALQTWRRAQVSWLYGFATSFEEVACRDWYYRMEADSLAAWARASRCDVVLYSFDLVRQYRMRDDPGLRSAMESLRKIEMANEDTD
jgi:hypothetical protein